MVSAAMPLHSAFKSCAEGKETVSGMSGLYVSVRKITSVLARKTFAVIKRHKNHLSLEWWCSQTD